MKRLLPLMGLALTTAMPAAAQDAEPLTSGYAKVHVEVKAVPANKTGSVIKLSKSTSVATWKSDWVLPVDESNDTRKKAATIQISDGGGSLYLWTRDGQTDKTYRLTQFYLDDGDGEFDADKDAVLAVGSYGGDVMLMPNPTPSSSAYTHQIVMASSLFDVYATEAEAAASTLPEKPQVLIYAFYGNGDFVGVADGYSNFGTASISNLQNKPGDDITLTATAEEGYEFAYWKDALQGGNKVSTENPLVTKSVGGRTYYAVFFEQGAPVLEFPEEGGFMMINSDKNWAVDEFANFQNYFFFADDIINQDNSYVFNLAADNATRKVVNRNNPSTWYWNKPNLCYGKGTVRMAYSKDAGEAKGGIACIFYTSKDLTLRTKDIKSVFESGDSPAYIYIWNEPLQAFLPYGSTADGASVVVPAGSAYMVLLNRDLPAVGIDAAAYTAATDYLATPVTVNIGSDGFATLATDRALDFSAATTLEAYRATVSGEQVTFHRVTRAPAGTGLLLRSLSGTGASESVNVVAAAPQLANALKPASAEAEGQRYVLSRRDGLVAFRPAADALTIGDGKAFLDVPAGVSAPVIALPGSETTEIKGFTDLPIYDLPIYSLSGQRVARASAKGVYIRNGKKFVR